MDGRYSTSPFLHDQDDNENSPENSCDSPTSTIYDAKTTTSSSSPKRSRRTLQKRVVSVPIRAVEGSGLKSENSAPPSDSWAWRKYGQKPIKGSPYPRGYYRCSSSKGCPARKQVERSRVDPTMLVITYSCDHNHPWPASRNNSTTNHPHHHSAAATTAATAVETPTTTPTTTDVSDSEILTVFDNQMEPDPDEKFGSLGLIGGEDYRWFPDLESSAFSTPILGEESDAVAAEEEDSLFADLGELPECSMVFRRGVVEEVRRRCGLTPWCGTTG